MCSFSYSNSSSYSSIIHTIPLQSLHAKFLQLKTHRLVFWARIFKREWGPGIDSKEWPPAYVARRAGTITLFLLGS
jgi:hypothetical protein